MDDIEYWYGNPSIEVCKGEIQICSEITNCFCIIDIPTSLVIQDICDFLKPFIPSIHELRILRSSSSKFYYCAVLLQHTSESLNFLQEFEGKQYNEIEPNTCNVVSLKSWDFKPDASPLQMEKCPICLEEIDKVAISVLCGHKFHVKCLALWSDPTCPVCRYHQSPPDTSACDTCGEETDVRMCLICGELGCNPHSNDHFASTGHTFFQEVESSTTWDYSRQVSISRLINTSDKIVELQDSKKSESIMFEYNCLLSILLETQKEFYEAKISEIEKEPNALAAQVKEVKSENNKLKKLVEEQVRVKEDLDLVTMKISEETKRKKDLTAINEDLQTKAGQRKVFKVTNEVRQEIIELEEQIKEMNFYIETQKRLQNMEIDSIEIRPKK